MKRRSFLLGSAAAIAATALPIPVMALAPAPAFAPELPVGFVMPFQSATGVGYTIHAGGQRFIECSGQLISRAEYPELFGVLNKLFGFSIRDDDLFGMPALKSGTDYDWNASTLPILTKEPGPTYQPDLPEMHGVAPLRDKDADDLADANYRRKVRHLMLLTRAPFR